MVGLLVHPARRDDQIRQLPKRKLEILFSLISSSHFGNGGGAMAPTIDLNLVSLHSMTGTPLSDLGGIAPKSGPWPLEDMGRMGLE